MRSRNKNGPLFIRSSNRRICRIFSPPRARSYGMADDHHSSIVAFSSKIAVEQAGDDTGMSSSEPGIIFMIPVSLYTVGMHHQDTSIHQGVCEFSNPWHACS